MSTEQNKTVVRRWIEGLNTRDIEFIDPLVDKIYTADFIVHNDVQPAVTMGREDLRQFARTLLKDTPDFHLAIEDLVAEEDRVASRLTLSGTDASTGKPVHLMIMQIWRIAGGQAAEAWQLAIPAATKL